MFRSGDGTFDSRSKSGTAADMRRGGDARGGEGDIGLFPDEELTLLGTSGRGVFCDTPPGVGERGERGETNGETPALNIDSTRLWMSSTVELVRGLKSIFASGSLL